MHWSCISEVTVLSAEALFVDLITRVARCSGIVFHCVHSADEMVKQKVLRCHRNWVYFVNVLMLK